MGVQFATDDDTVSFSTAGPARYFRAVLLTDDGVPTLYNLSLLRDLHLEFDEVDWEDQLAANYGTGTNLLADLTVAGVAYPRQRVARLSRFRPAANRPLEWPTRIRSHHVHNARSNPG